MILKVENRVLLDLEMVNVESVNLELMYLKHVDLDEGSMETKTLLIP